MSDVPGFMLAFWGCLALLVPLYGLWFWRLLSDTRRVLASDARNPQDSDAALRNVRQRYTWILVALNAILALAVLGLLVATGTGWTAALILGSVLAVVCVAGAFVQASFWMGLVSSNEANRTKVSS